MEKLIIAGAGCGKTTYILKNIQKGDLYLTFNVANKEQAVLRGSKGKVSTFNSLGKSIIAKNNIDWRSYWNDGVPLPDTEQFFLIAQILSIRDFGHTVSCKTLWVDEGQDLTPPLIEGIKKIKFENIVIVEDPNQSIYEFIGAGQDLKKAFPEAKVEYLYKTYRFGKEIADLSNKFRDNDLESLKPNCSKVIAGGIEDLLKLNGTKAILCRDNRECLEIKKKLRKMGVKVLFKNWEDKIDEMTEEEFIQYKKKAVSFDYAAFGLPTPEDEIHPMLRTNLVYVDNIHKSKGLEWDNVFLTMKNPCFKHITKRGVLTPVVISDINKVKQEEINVYYVGLTRAKKTLIVPDLKSVAIHFKESEND